VKVRQIVIALLVPLILTGVITFVFKINWDSSWSSFKFPGVIMIMSTGGSIFTVVLAFFFDSSSLVTFKPW